jgi:hypothetical protein
MSIIFAVVELIVDSIDSMIEKIVYTLTRILDSEVSAKIRMKFFSRTQVIE